MMAEEFYGVRENNRIKASEGPTIVVLAKMDGHYKHYRYARDPQTGTRLPAFEVPLRLYSERWMEPANEQAAEALEQYKIQRIKDQKATLLAELAAKKKALESEEADLKAIIGNEPAAETAAESEGDDDKEHKRGPGRPKKA